MDNVECKLIDGSSISGELERAFRPMEAEAVVRSEGRVHAISLDRISCILFQSNSEDSYPPHMPGELVEDITTRNNEVYIVRVLQQQAEGIGHGFYGIPSDPENGYKRIFFPKTGILSRNQHRPIGEILKQEGNVSNDKIQDALDEQQQSGKRKIGDIISDKHNIPKQTIEGLLEKVDKERVKGQHLFIGDVLVAADLVTREQVDEALEDQLLGVKKQVGEILIEKKIITEKDLLMALALKFRLRFVDLNDVCPDPATLDMVSSDLVRELKIFPISSDEGKIVVVTGQPTNMSIADTLRIHTNRWAELVVSTPHQIEEYIDKYYPIEESDADNINVEAVLADVEVDADSQNLSLKSEAETAPIIRLANKILSNGIKASASDIHILPQETALKVSYRVNGLLRQYLRLDRRLHKSLIARFKIIALMDITERRLPQDGRFKAQLQNRSVEFRVSCMPGQFGENLVLRVLDKSSNKFDLSQLGMEDKDVESIRHIVRSTHGVLLVTGPTGSGKSTTLTTVLRDLVDEPKHLLSLEDPIESEVPGVNQIQVNEKIGFSFASALRNVLRHDPDVIMVGEIRDPETAKIAVQAALTGHVLLSSLHTNRASGTFSRLVDMGVESYLVSATVKGVMAQHLLPKLCEKCRTTRKPDEKALKFLSSHGVNVENLPNYVSTGCEQCHDTGISGRNMVYEFLKVDLGIQKLVTQEAAEEEIQEMAAKSGMRSMVDMAVEAAKKGYLSINQIIPLLIE